VELLIDSEGQSLRPCDGGVDQAIWKLGFIHLRAVGSSVTVTLSPRLVQAATMTGAFYEIADLDPEFTYVAAHQSDQECEVFSDFRSALCWINALVAAAGNVKPYPADAAIEHSELPQAARSFRRTTIS
jgi:hypothetical protein